MRVLRDMHCAKVEKIRIDSRETYTRLMRFSREFVPELAPLIEHYAGERPLFDLYGVEDEIQRALERRVALKSGGYLILDQTEAMTTIDVNTGAFVGGRNLEETIFKTNLEAAQAIARQLRLRNLGGIIIIDFIDMRDREHRQQVLQSLQRSLERDHARNAISEVSSLGLVEMTRKRTRESLEHVLCEPCPACSGRGVLKTAETVCLEIFREIIREIRQYNVQELLVLASNEVVARLVDEEADTLSELEAFTGVNIKFRAESQYNQEQYDVVLL
jgi:ribonuclease G